MKRLAGLGNVRKSSSSKAAAVLTHGAYIKYVSASGAKRQVCEPEGQAKARERRWWLFSTFPEGNWLRGRTVRWEFPDVEMVQTWYQSEDYVPLLKLRKEISNDSIILIKDGVTLAD